MRIIKNNEKAIKERAKAIQESNVEKLLEIIHNNEQEGNSLSNICLGLYDYSKSITYESRSAFIQI